MINITIKLLRKQVKIVKWLYVEGIRTDFLIDSNQPYQQVLQERDAITGTLLAHYTYGHDLLAQHTPSYGPAYYHYDAQLSTRILNDSTAFVQNRYEYSAFGSKLKLKGMFSNVFRFTGEVYDEETNLLYLRSRYYRDGRFMNADEDTYDIKQPGTKNEYVYGVNNPVMNVDPNGRFYASTILSGLIRGILAYIVINNMIGPSWSTFFGKEVDFARRGMILSFTKGFVNTHRGRDDCEAMVEIYKYAGMLYGGGTNEDEYRFVNELEAILTPHDGPMALLTREQNSRPKYYSGDVTNITQANEFFNDEGFAEEFRDRSNQVQHFTAFFAIGYFWGPGMV